MKKLSLEDLFSVLHDDIEHQLINVRKVLVHPVAKGDASEAVWLNLFKKYLPQRYQVDKAFIVDSNECVSDQIDVVIFDRQYTPFIFHYNGNIMLPAESVYAVFETKQICNSRNIKYAQEKISSVRQLHRTSLSIPHAGGTYPPKVLFPIIGGILTLDSEWDPPLGKSLEKVLKKAEDLGRLDFGCVASHGYFSFNKATSNYDIQYRSKPLTIFLLKLISELQFCGTVPMIDVDAYAKWI